jgi:uncharacterized membrane protein YhaH (DUF805 family)
MSTPRTYLEGAPAGLYGAARGALRHIVTYEGRASRSAFWWFALLEAIVYLVASLLAARVWVAGAFVSLFAGLPMAIAGIALAVRRLHDSDRSGWWWWIVWVPVLGWIALIYFYLLPGTPGTNRYSPRSAFIRTG